jgi:hypothetical protein
MITVALPLIAARVPFGVIESDPPDQLELFIL